MPLRLDVKRKLLSRSDRVKAVDLHSTEPWICTALYNGTVHIWNFEIQQLIKTFEVSSNPVRAVKFVARKNWIITGSDDLQLRVFNYNTLERIRQLEAHSDYIRSIAVHPVQPFVLTSSDDMLIRLWDWDKNWTCAQVFEGHSHYVMQLVFNPKDSNTFASASLDHTVKVWSLGSATANFTLDGHSRGVNCVDYCFFGDKPYLASGSDDKTVKIWDYHTKACVHTLDGHTQNISCVAFHPELPVILTGSEDGTVRMWHSNTYRLESTLNYGLERVWAMVCQRGKQMVGLGYDEGTLVISLGRDEPAMSMDGSGKLVCSHHTELRQANVRALSLTPDAVNDIPDGEALPVSFKEMGTSEIYPQTIEHSPNGRFVAVCGDSEYIVYTAMALRSKTFGQALEFVWSLTDNNMYAVRESNSLVKVYKQFKELRTFKLDYGVEQIFGGHLLGVRSLTGLAFYDWSSGRLIRRIEISPRSVYWNESGQLVCLCTTEAVFILRYSADQVPDKASTAEQETEGFEEAFKVIPNGEVNTSVRNGLWFGDAFLFISDNNCLCYYVGGEQVTIAHLDRTMYLLGYLAKENRIYLADRNLQVVSYSLLLNVLLYETAVMRGDFPAADAIFPSIPVSHRTKIAQFLEKQGFRAQAIKVTTDPDHKFELALQLGDHQLCRELADSEGDLDANASKWRQLAEAACRKCDLGLAHDCLSKVRDFPSLLLLATCAGDLDSLRWIGREAAGEAKDNVAFLASFLASDLEACLKILVDSDRLPEAAFFTRAYLPSRVPEVVELWRGWLTRTSKSGAKFAQRLANPEEYPNLFPDWEDMLSVEKWLKKRERSDASRPPASAYATQATAVVDRDPLVEYRNSQEYDILVVDERATPSPLVPSLPVETKQKQVEAQDHLEVPDSTGKGLASNRLAASSSPHSETPLEDQLEHELASMNLAQMSTEALRGDSSEYSCKDDEGSSWEKEVDEVEEEEEEEEEESDEEEEN